MRTWRQDSSDALQSLLTADEEVRWHARPRWQSLLGQYLVYGVPALFFLGPFVFVGLFVLVFVVSVAVDSLGVFVGGLLVSGVATVSLVYGLVYLAAKRAYANAEYAATDDRLIAFGGLLGRDYSSVRWDDVQDVHVEVGWLDGRYGTGTIEAIVAGRATSGVQFGYVEEPYDALERLEAVSRGDTR